jgi:hypothetical protein
MSAVQTTNWNHTIQMRHSIAYYHCLLEGTEWTKYCELYYPLEAAVLTAAECSTQFASKGKAIPVTVREGP